MYWLEKQSLSHFLIVAVSMSLARSNLTIAVLSTYLESPSLSTLRKTREAASFSILAAS